jgi:hypothetical protein
MQEVRRDLRRVRDGPEPVVGGEAGVTATATSSTASSSPQRGVGPARNNRASVN